MLNILNHTSVWEAVRPKVLSKEPLTTYERFAMWFSGKYGLACWALHFCFRRARLTITSRLPKFRRLYSEMVQLSREFLESNTSDGEFGDAAFTDRFVKSMSDYFGMNAGAAEDLAFELCCILYRSHKVTNKDFPVDTERFAREVVEIADAFVYGRSAWDEYDIAFTVIRGFGIDYKSVEDIGYLLNDMMLEALSA